MAELIPFHYHDHEITVHLDETNEPWWEAKVVCPHLGLANVSRACSRLDEDEKRVITSSDVTGRQQEILIVNEAGLYALILNSRKPAAKAFKRWITHEVLPTIRKTGTYTAQPVPDPVDRYPELRAIRELIVATAEARDEATLARQEAQDATARAVRAETKADLALADTRHMTLEEFVIANSLLRQFPLTAWAALATRLGDYCALHNLKTFKVPVHGKPWPEEIVYPLQALGWLVRYPPTPHPVLRFPQRAKES